MSPFHIFLTLLVVVVWGVNFLFVKLALVDLSPLMLGFLRFTLASIPAIFFIRPPSGSFKIVCLYGLFTFALQFTLLFIGIKLGMTAGMASLLLQVQVFFSILIAAIFLGERPGIHQLIGAIVSFIGIGIVAIHFDKNISFWGFMFILAAAAAWGAGNAVSKKAKNINMLALVVWGSFVASIPMLLLSLFIEGPHAIVDTYHHITWLEIISVLYITYISTWLGYGVWNWLLSRHAVVTIVPFTLLVPIVGMLSSIIFLGESCELWKLYAALLVISGVGISLFSARFFTSNEKTVLSPAEEG